MQMESEEENCYNTWEERKTVKDGTFDEKTEQSSIPATKTMTKADVLIKDGQWLRLHLQ